MFSLAGKVAVITGAGSGIGAAIAHCFADAGSNVYVVDRDEAGGAGVVESIRSRGGRADFLQGDVSNNDSCNQVARQVLADGACDILVNNAGIGHVGTLLTTTTEDLDRLYAVNVRGAFQMSKLFLPGMMDRKTGSIINLASIGGVVAVRDRIAYCATKFAIVGLTKCIALDHAESKVRCNCICPGRVETPFVQARLAEYPDPKKAYEEMASTQALKRMAKPDEIAAAALYLAADESSFVTGSALIIDGGWSAGK